MTTVLRKLVQRIDADIYEIIILVLESDSFLLNTTNIQCFKAREASNAVIDMNDIVAGLQFA